MSDAIIFEGAASEFFFDIEADPQERINLIGSKNPAVKAALADTLSRLEFYRRSMVPIRNIPADANARPAPVPGLNICTPCPKGPILCGDIGVWKPWQADPPPLVVKSLDEQLLV
jgi:hypothetical protein